MKKILSILSVLLIMTGCSLTDMDNTPTKQVETYLNNYQTLDSNVLTELDAIVNNEEMFDEDQKVTYRDILKKHYQDLTYTIKEETVNGDKATVEHSGLTTCPKSIPTMTKGSIFINGGRERIFEGLVLSC